LSKIKREYKIKMKGFRCMKRELIPIFLEIQDLMFQLKEKERSLNNIELELKSFKEENLKIIGEKEIEFEKITKEIRELKDKQGEKEDKVSILREKLQQEEKRILTLRNPKELMHTEEEIEDLKKQVTGMEDEILDMMVILEEKGNSQKSIDSELKKLKEDFSQKEKEYLDKIEGIKNEIADLNKEISEKKTDIPSEDLKEFETLLKQKNNRAISRIINKEICEGCKLTIPKIALEKARKGELVNCPNCGRILWME